MTKSKIFLGCCLIFIFGVALASFLPASIFANDLAWFLGVVLFLMIVIVFWQTETVRVIALLGLFLFFSFWRFSLSLAEDAPDKIWHYNGQEMKIIGLVAGERDERDKTARYVIRVQGADFSGQMKEISGKILLTAGLFPSYDYGDRLEMVCGLEAPSAVNFPYDRYLARYDIYSLCNYAKINLLSGGHGNFFYAKIFKIKNIIRERINRGLKEPEAGLASGFILGDLKAIDKNLSQDFSRAGLSHIVAVSGANISILSGIVMSLCVFWGLGRKLSFYVASASLVAYIILVGLPASAMRAGVMGFLILWALYLGRINKMENALALAASLMLVINPKLLRDDIGFQLSFLALLGLVYVYPLLNYFFASIRISGIFKMRETVAMTMAAQILTLPVIIYNFSQASLVAIISNVLVLWTLPVLMVIFPVVLLIAFIIRPIDFVIFLIPDMILRYIIFITKWSVKLPYAYVEINFYGAWLIWIIYYLFWIGVIVRYKKLIKIQI